MCLTQSLFYILIVELWLVMSIEFTREPQGQVVEPGNAVSLACHTDAISRADWYRNGLKIATYESEWQQINDDNRHDLFILEVRPDVTTGTYHCVVRSPNSAATLTSASATITVPEMANFEKSPSDETVLLGEDATVDCQLIASFSRNSTVHWLKDGRSLDLTDRRFFSDSHGLEIRSVSLQDQGNYYCLVKSGSQSFRSSTAHLKVVYPPREDPTGVHEVTGFISRDLIMSCPLMGEPAISCQWSRAQGLQLPATRAMQTNNKLVIGHIEGSDAGDYVCVCSNQFGQARAVVSVRVPTDLEFLQKPQDTVALEGYNVSIPCLVRSASPDIVSIVWEKKESSSTAPYSPMMFQGERQGNKMVHENGTLSITNVTTEDKGYYVCRAIKPTSSTDGSIEETINLDVRTHSNQMPPVITVAPFNHTIRPGGTIRLECQASSPSVVTIAWRYINGAWQATKATHISAGSRIQVADNGSFTVSDAKYEDAGLYKCQAVAPGASTERSAVIAIRNDGLEVSPTPSMLPRAVRKPIAFRVTEDSISLRWDPGANISPWYTIEMYSYEKHVFAWETVAQHVYDTKFTVEKLTPGADYVFIVRGVNEIGVGLPSPVSDVIKTITPVTSALTGLREREVQMMMELVEVEALMGVSVNATSAWISWNVLHNAGHVQGFRVKYTMHDGSNSFAAATYTQVEVQDQFARAVLLTGLEPWSSYVAKIEPYYDSVRGAESGQVFFSTPQGVPRNPPAFVQLHRLKANQYTVTWNKPTRCTEGHIIGYSVLVEHAEYSGKSTNYTTLASVFKHDVTLGHAGDDFRVSVAAMTKAGAGVYSMPLGPEHIISPGKESWRRHMPWILGIAGGVVWLALCFFIVFLCLRSRRSIYKSVRTVKYERNQPIQEYGPTHGQWQMMMMPNGQQSTISHQMMQLTPPNSTGGPAGSRDHHPVYISNPGQAAAYTLRNPQECCQPLMVDLDCFQPSQEPPPPESAYQCAGDCYDECETPHYPQVTPCACKQHMQKQRLGSASGTPIQLTAAAVPNRYHTTLPNMQEPLYNELDGVSPDGSRADRGSSYLPHHYEIYDSELGTDAVFQSSEPLLANGGYMSQGHPQSHYQTDQQPVRPANSTPRSSCPKMGMSVVRNSMQTPVNFGH
uniref:Robo3 protein n=1 Tax=Isodiametra pulchra TaxID=504439 RepID=A0A2P1DV83_ISOPU|nr:Robo3 protein [Isodiametra pulchra]